MKLLTQKGEEERSEDTVETDKEWGKSDEESVDEVADTEEDGWKLDLEERLEGSVDTVCGESLVLVLFGL
jgi:hypothetical protein